ncbi:MAG: bifunctional aspartate kinase/diaminopimelate decarboxylase, partial [Pseudomonadota bacterium]
ECVSPQEVEHLRTAVPDLSPDRILFTPNFAPRADYEWARAEGITLTLDNLFPLREWPGVFDGLEIFIRIDPDVGRGHHEHVITAGEHSKFGIPRFEVDELVELTRTANAKVVGIHAHSGSGIPEADTWGLVGRTLAEVAQRFPSVRVLDLGGGLGVPAKPGDAAFDLAGMDAALSNVREAFPEYELWLEPGRYLVSQAGVLLTHATQLKGKSERRYVGVATGMNALIRPSLYDAYHEIVNLSRIDEPVVGKFTVVGPICETGDTLGVDRELPDTQSGDTMLLLNAGAYGRVMSSQYNLRPIPPEIMLPRR